MRDHDDIDRRHVVEGQRRREKAPARSPRIATCLPSRHVTNLHTADPAGGQGEVYEVDQEGTRYALKWYYPATRDARAEAQRQEQRQALREYIIPRGAPDPRFLWPLSFVDGEPGSGTFGYVMRLFPPDFDTLERLVCGRVKIDDRTLASVALGIVDGFRKLHLSGCVYKDINLGSFAFHPRTGEVLVVDNDNVRTNGTPVPTAKEETADAGDFLHGRANVAPSGPRDKPASAPVI